MWWDCNRSWRRRAAARETRQYCPLSGTRPRDWKCTTCWARVKAPSTRKTLPQLRIASESPGNQKIVLWAGRTTAQDRAICCTDYFTSAHGVFTDTGTASVFMASELSIATWTGRGRMGCGTVWDTCTRKDGLWDSLRYLHGQAARNHEEFQSLCKRTDRNSNRQTLSYTWEELPGLEHSSTQ